MDSQARSRSLRILVIDDVRRAGALTPEVLDLRMPVDVRFHVCTEAEEARTWLSATCFDLVYLALEMPDAHGLPWLREVRAIAGKTPIVALLEPHQAQLRLGALGAGAQDYVARDAVLRSRIEADIATTRYGVALESAVSTSPTPASLIPPSQSLAHDFNNLLSVIVGHASVALCKADPESDLRENLTRVTAAAEQAASLAQQLVADRSDPAVA